MTLGDVIKSYRDENKVSMDMLQIYVASLRDMWLCIEKMLILRQDGL